MPAIFLPGYGHRKCSDAASIFPVWSEGRLDSHHELPVIEKSLKALWAADMSPYRRFGHSSPW